MMPVITLVSWPGFSSSTLTGMDFVPSLLKTVHPSPHEPSHRLLYLSVNTLIIAMLFPGNTLRNPKLFLLMRTAPSNVPKTSVSFFHSVMQLIYSTPDLFLVLYCHALTNLFFRTSKRSRPRLP